jgi:hypothetical protein
MTSNARARAGARLPDGGVGAFARTGLCAALLLGCLAAGAGHATAAESSAIEGTTYAGPTVTPETFDGDLRNLPARPSGVPATKPYRPLLRPPGLDKVPPPDAPIEAPEPAGGPLAPMPSPTQNFAGLNFNDLCGGVQCGAGWPPDTNGDVGLNHYIQAVNDGYAIFNKSGTLLTSFTEDQLWSTTGANPCNGNSQGDPIVVYDALADRWILTHFAFAVSGPNPVAPFYQCVAVSKTGDPVAGGWYLYALQMDPGGAGKPPASTLNDYGKFGIWNDCLYMAANGFTMPSGAFAGTLFASFSRADMYSGSPLTWSLGFINNTSDPFTMIPSNLSGQAGSALPAGTPNYFVSESGTAFNFEVRKFTAGANCGGGGTLSGATIVSQTSYPFATGAVVAQPNTANKLDNLSDRLMQKVQYRKVGASESLWIVHGVNGSGANTTRPQWAQLNVTGQVIATTPVQQQIYAPDTTLNRWMPSLAVDRQGNMALGYSTSNGTVPNFPSIAYSGRLVGDPLNTLPQTETQLIAGGGSQANSCGGPCDRWGDYTAMSVDPADDCTFWYTNEYYSSQTNGNSGNWQTRIGSFKFPACVPTVPGAPITVIAVAGNAQATVSFTAPGSGGSAITGYVVTSIPAGGIDVNAGSIATTHTVTGLTNGTSYTFTVRATNGIGTGPPSAPSNSVIPFAPAFPLVPSNIIYVARSGGDHTSIQSAINAAAPHASAINPILIKIAPGLYQEQVTLKDYVDIEGSGLRTAILYTGAGGTVITGAQSEMRNLQVVNINNASNPGANAIFQTGNTVAGSTKLTNVQVIADGPADNLAVYVSGGTLLIAWSDVLAALNGSQTTLEAGIFATGGTASVIFKNGTLGAFSGSPQNSARQVSGGKIALENALMTGATFGTPLCFRTFAATTFTAVTCP